MFAALRRSKPKYTLLESVKARATRFNFLMFSTIGLTIAFVVLLAVLLARPRSVGPNVALFDLSSAVMPPRGSSLTLVYLGYGTQNYTCNTTVGVYTTNDTAVATLLDVTRYYTGSAVLPVPPVQDLQAVGSHYYVPNPVAPAQIAPKFQNGDGFVIGSKNNSVASNLPSFSVATVLLQNVQPGKAGGTMADWVVRTNVVGGAVPSELNKCQAGDTFTVPYRANYLFFQQ